MAHSVGKTIVTLRKGKNWTQAELADKIGVSDKAVSKWESESGLPDTATFPKLAEIFGVSIDYLMTGPKENKPTTDMNQPTNPCTYSVEEQENMIAGTIHGGIIHVDELLATQNFPIIKKALEEHPIHPIEIDYANLMKVYDALEQRKWRDLFVFAVDNNAGTTIAMAILNHDVDKIKKELENQEKIYIGKWKDSYSYMYMSGYTTNHYRTVNSQRLRIPSQRDSDPNGDLKSILTHIHMCKNKIIEDASLKWDKEKIIGNLTKEYFYDELSKGNIEMIIIKLCVRLEAILKSDYHYKGDLADMLNQYCSQHGTEDDDWGEYTRDRDFVKYLRKLRKQRNSIVHSEKEEEEMTEEEIRFCIEYICQMG